MAKDSYYLVFRSYKKKERSDPMDRKVFYGWSQSKNVILAFLEQRNSKKYYVQKMSEDAVSKLFGEELEDGTMINFVELRSAKSLEMVKLFITPFELKESEKRIQKMFRDASTLSPSAGEDIMSVIELFMNLDDYYGQALFFLGFRPSEIDDLFPSADPSDDWSNTLPIEDQIDDSYYNSDCDIPGMVPVTPFILENVSKQIIYSLESFIKVLRDDM